MRVSDILELEIVSVLERGSPNKECIAIQAKESINLGQYGIMIGEYSTNGGVFPFRDNMFWFGDGLMKEGDWLFVYTGAGSPFQSKASDNIHDIYTIFWGRAHTLFANSNIVPMLFRIDAVDILLPPSNAPQLSQ